MDNIIEQEQYNRVMIESFIKNPKKFFWYKKAFKKFIEKNPKVAQWHWSWWAFVGGPFFFLNRKLYMASLFMFCLLLLASLNKSFLSLYFISQILAGGYGAYFVFKAYQKERSKIEANFSNLNERIDAMKQTNYRLIPL